LIAPLEHITFLFVGLRVIESVSRWETGSELSATRRRKWRRYWYEKRTGTRAMAK